MTTTEPTFHLLCAPPGAGKTTYAATFRRHEMAYICPDDLRLALTGDTNDQSRNGHIFTRMVPSLIAKAASEGRDVLFDACSVSRKSRAGLLEQAKGLGYLVKVHVITATLEECLARNAARERVIPEAVIRRMHAQFQMPDKRVESDIDDVIHLVGKPNPDGTLTFWSH